VAVRAVPFFSHQGNEGEMDDVILMIDERGARNKRKDMINTGIKHFGQGWRITGTGAMFGTD
jgi:hypothetical protein